MPSLLLLFGFAQFFRPQLKSLPHEPLLAGSSLTPQVREVMERACQDCHSNNTRWPWYARTVPMNWIVTSDVSHGRAFMNLTEWQYYNRSKQLGYLAAMSAAATNRKMPPPTYSLIHPDARLTDGERMLISQWARSEYVRLRRMPYSAK